MATKTRLESLVEIGRAFEASGRWDEIKLDGTGEKPVLIIRGSNSQQDRTGFTARRTTITGFPYKEEKDA